MAEWLATGALIVAIFAAAYAKRSADASDRASLSAEKSARAAELSAEADGKLAQVELARDHRDLAPQSDWATFVTEKSPVTDRTHLFMVMTAPRSYLVQSDLVFEGGGREPSRFGRGNMLQCGIEDRMSIGDIDGPIPTHVELRCFPLLPESGAADPWDCPCGGPVIGDHNDPAHWVIRVDVKPPRTPPPPLVARG